MHHGHKIVGVFDDSQIRIEVSNVSSAGFISDVVANREEMNDVFIFR